MRERLGKPTIVGGYGKGRWGVRVSQGEANKLKIGGTWGCHGGDLGFLEKYILNFK